LCRAPQVVGSARFVFVVNEDLRQRRQASMLWASSEMAVRVFIEKWSNEP